MQFVSQAPFPVDLGWPFANYPAIKGSQETNHSVKLLSPFSGHKQEAPDEQGMFRW